jgi:predicted ArsR family transcriptional regulator
MASNRSTSDTRRRVLTWKKHGWSALEIATKLGVTTQTVYYHLHALEAAGELENGIRRYRKRAS